MSHFEIKLDGKAEVPLPAERAILEIQVSAEQHEKQTVSRQVVSIAKRVESLLRELSPLDSSAEAKEAAPLDYWSRTSLSESSQVPYNNKGEDLPRKFKAEISFTPRFQRFDKLGWLIDKLSDLSNIDIKKVEWVLTPETIALHKSDLRLVAAKDALHKAKEYAAALGYRQVRPVELEEGQNYVQSTNRKGGYVPTGVTTNQARNQIEAEGWEHVGKEAFAYQPEEVKMSLTVHAKFHADTSDLVHQ